MIQTSPDFLHQNINSGIILDLKSEKYHIQKKILEYRLAHGEAIVLFDGIDCIQSALKLVGYNVFSDDNKENTPGITQENLVGFSVEDIQKKKWGTVKDISQHHLNQVMEVSGEDHTFLIPFHRSIIKKIDKHKKVITIDPPKGLEDINK